MTRRKPDLLYRREIDGKTLTLTQLDGVYELKLVNPVIISTPTVIAIALVDPTYSKGT